MDRWITISKELDKISQPIFESGFKSNLFKFLYFNKALRYVHIARRSNFKIR